MNAEIYSIYEWINGFMGLTLGVMGGDDAILPRIGIGKKITVMIEDQSP